MASALSSPLCRRYFLSICNRQSLLALILHSRGATLSLRGGLTSTGRDAFIQCWTGQIATTRQREILDCARDTDSPSALAICASEGALNPDARKAADCAQAYADNKQAVGFVKCMSDSYLDDTSASLVNCAIGNHGSYVA